MSTSKEIWVDQGGTFTDSISVVDGVVQVSKHLTHLEQSFDENTTLRKGTTVATNALLEGTSKPVLLITNRGLGEVWDIGNQCRDKLFDLYGERRKRFDVDVLEINGRISADGQILQKAHLTTSVLKRYQKSGIQSVAVVLLHGILCPEEENRIAQKVCEAGFLNVSVGHQLSPSIGFLKRLTTTIADAALSPLLPRQKGLYMCTDGGLAQQDSSEWTGVKSVLSGPAGGAVAVAQICSRLGISKAFGFDMGGTSSDLCHIRDNEISRIDGISIDGIQIQTPSIEIKTVAAGGGSILGQQEGMFRVGPQSVGSNPGPVCYGRGSKHLSMTDAEAVLGRLVNFPEVCGPNYDEALYIDETRKKFKEQFREQSVEETAVSFQQVAAQKMSTAIFRHAAEKNVEPSAYTLVAFGGAGPAHACRVADCLGIAKIVVPILASVFSAWGISKASKRYQRIVPLHQNKDKITKEDIDSRIEGICKNVVQEEKIQLDDYIQTLFVRLKYKGTGEGIWLPFTSNQIDEMDVHFEIQHQNKFGYTQQNTPIEWVEIKWVCEEDVSNKNTKYTFKPLQIPQHNISSYFESKGCWIDVPAVSWEEVQDGMAGPMFVLLEGSTIVVEDGWIIEKGDEAIFLRKIENPIIEKTKYVSHFHPMQTSIFGMRIMCIAEQMGQRLSKISRSVSIRERHDFSCAIFDRHGSLIANAPHVPVHLGAMGETIASLISMRGDEIVQGTAWVSNNPYLGGSHLPDITVVMPFFYNDQRVAFVACRAHHIDVGGIQKGSMPPFSQNIDEEGFLLTHQLLHNGQSFETHNIDLSRSKQQDDVWADLQAQYSACLYGIHNLQMLFEQMGMDVCVGQFQALLEHASKIAQQWLSKNVGTYKETEIIDGENEHIEMKVELNIQSDRGFLTIDAPHSIGNFNTPRAVVKAALLFVLRSVIDDDIPLNAGFLNVWNINVNEDGLCDPVEPRAVVAGNVETSQHIVDAIVRALGIQASSQGTMNNLVFSSLEHGSSYETIGGGTGAGKDKVGGSAVQMHMTNTMATDIEVLEGRFPIRVLQWTTRKNSGGKGLYKGGDGLVKEWLFLEEMEVSLLATRRNVSPKGLMGGGDGQVGIDWVFVKKEGCWKKLSFPKMQVEAGDKLKIQTPSGGGYGNCE